MKLTITSIHNQLKLNRSLVMLGITLATLSLSACGGGKNISSKDSSAEYKSAQSLPPLKKPSGTEAIVSAPGATTPEVASESAQNTVADNSNDVSRPAVVTANESEVGSSTISASVTTNKPGQARLEIAADFDQAWDYLSSSLQKSDITVFSRNKEAGRFSIGCANIAAAPTVTRSGRWSFFNRSKENLEHCALQAIGKRGSTTVSVLNRAGEEVSGEYSNEVFGRLLNN